MGNDLTGWQVACMCCGIQGRPLANPRAPGKLPTSRTICKPCAKHQGSELRDLEKRNTEHVIFWRSHLADEVAKLDALHERELAKLAGIIKQKDEELEDRPIQVVHENLDQEAVDNALVEREIAWQHRDSAFGLLSQIKAWHRDKGDGNCWCGLSLSKCKVRKLLFNDQILIKWERKQLERLRRSDSHSLPWNHPALMDPRWVVEG